MRSRRNRAVVQFELRLIGSKINTPLLIDSIRTGFLVRHLVAVHRFIFLANGLLVIITGRKLQVDIVLKLKEPFPKLESLVKLERVRNREIITDVDTKVVVKCGRHPRCFKEVLRRIRTVFAFRIIRQPARI